MQLEYRTLESRSELTVWVSQIPIPHRGLFLGRVRECRSSTAAFLAVLGTLDQVGFA